MRLVTTPAQRASQFSVTRVRQQCINRWVFKSNAPAFRTLDRRLRRGTVVRAQAETESPELEIDEAASGLDPMHVEEDTGRFLLERAVVPKEDLEWLHSHYHLFPMETYVFQVKKDEQGRLDLRDITILDRNTGEKRKAYVLSELPDEPMHFFDLPWQTEFLGNILKDQPPRIWVWAYYLIVQRGADRRQGLDLDCVYRLDGQEGTVERCSVLRVAPPETPENQLLLRIKQNGRLVLDERETTPPPQLLVEAAISNIDFPSYWEYQTGAMEYPTGPRKTDEHAQKEHRAGSMQDLPPDENFFRDVDMEGGLEDFDTPASDR